MKSDVYVDCNQVAVGMIISDGSTVMEVIQVTYRSTFGVRFVYREYPNGVEYISRLFMGRPTFYYFGMVSELENAA